MPHPLIDQLRFTRHEFKRALRDLSEEDACKRLLPMNSISWNVGHLAWQEQRYFLWYGLGQMPYPEIDNDFAFGCPASTPALEKVLSVWQDIIKISDSWLDHVTVESLQKPLMHNERETNFGNLIWRTLYHYWYHIGENLALRQQLGHSNLPVFVGNLDGHAPYRPEQV